MTSTPDAVELCETINPLKRRIDSSGGSKDAKHEIKINVGDHKKHDDAVAEATLFPVSNSHVGNCSCAKRLCGHGLTDTDDIILRQERKRLENHLDKEPVTFNGKYKYMKVAEDAFFAILKPPKVCQRGAAKWSYHGIQMLAILYMVLFSVTRYAFQSLCVEETFFLLASTKSGCMYCSSVEQQLQHSQYTHNITGYPGMLHCLFLRLLTCSFSYN